MSTPTPSFLSNCLMNCSINCSKNLELLIAYRLPQAKILTASNKYLPRLAASNYSYRLPQGATIIITVTLFVFNMFGPWGCAQNLFVGVGGRDSRPLFKGETLQKWLGDIFENGSEACFSTKFEKGGG